MNDERKGPGSFWLPPKTIDALITAKATAAEIAALLIIAKHTEATGQYSTAGKKAVYTLGGMSQGAAEKAIEALTLIKSSGQRASQPEPKRTKNLGRLVYTAENWEQLTGEVLPHGPGARSQIRFVVNTLDTKQTEGVWFGAGLVEGVGTFQKPLKRLRQLGSVAARLLLLLYARNDMGGWVGVAPRDVLHGSYERDVYQEPIGNSGYAIECWTDNGSQTWLKVMGQCLGHGVDNRTLQETKDKFWKAANGLEESGYIYEVVMVATNPNDGKKNNFGNGADEAEPIYELDARSKHGYKPAGEAGLAGLTARTAGEVGYPVTREDGSFYGRYAAIVPRGMPVQIVGVYRLRFRVSNPKNHTVSGSWSALKERQQEALSWITEARERAHLEPIEQDRV